ncbi:coenzyme F420-0:L-glutamate ligase, partial [Candidatus Bathyarchaeota archaeon]|nr:coenzyme F420-0:L-glutamate ligase [Candidatus Bathyarchaeota archaeon]
MKFKTIKVRTDYWRPGTDHIREIISAVRDLVRDGDIVTVSEKAISTASDLLVDESRVEAGWLARLIAGFWMRRIWGGPLGRLTRLRKKTIIRLRGYPFEEGAAHKQLAIRYVGLLQALRHYSEGGIDASNLPYSLVSLPLKRPFREAERIRNALMSSTGLRLSVMIVDGDTTYSWRNLHLAP